MIPLNNREEMQWLNHLKEYDDDVLVINRVSFAYYGNVEQK
ncbi:hypothetical protein [Aliiglaciecola litoralis]